MANRRPLSDSSSLSVTEAAQYMRCSRDFVYQLIAEEQVRWYYRGKRKRILLSSIAQYEERRVGERLADWSSTSRKRPLFGDRDGRMHPNLTYRKGA